jgi:hypothetical protein
MTRSKSRTRLPHLSLELQQYSKHKKSVFKLTHILFHGGQLRHRRPYSPPSDSSPTVVLIAVEFILAAALIAVKLILAIESSPLFHVEIRLAGVARGFGNNLRQR